MEIESRHKCFDKNVTNIYNFRTLELAKLIYLSDRGFKNLVKVIMTVESLKLLQ